MNFNICNTKEISNDVLYNIKTENNAINQNSNSTAKAVPSSSSGSKLLTFIKAKPIFFALIVIGTTAVIAIAITVSLVLKNKDNKDDKTDEITLESNINENSNDNSNSNNNNNNNNSNNNNGNQENNNDDEIDNDIFDFSNVNIDSQYTAIGENSNTLNTFCEYLGGISFNLNNDKEKVYLIYK